MIEIVLDGNTQDDFCGQLYPVILIDAINLSSWGDYKQFAQNVITIYANNQAIIIRLKNPNISLNKLSLALFVESIKVENQLKYAVFKVENLQKSRDEYKPYVALTIAIKYALNLANETPKTIYKNIAELGYLGIKTQQDFVSNHLVLSLENTTSSPLVIKSDRLETTICGVALLKALSLAQTPVNIVLEIAINEQHTHINKDNLVEKIVYDISRWIN